MIRALRTPLLTAALALCCALGAAAQQPPALAPDPAQEAAVRALVQRYAQARRAQDAAAIAALFTEDADQLVSSGEWRRGRDAVVSGALQSSQRAGGERSIRLEAVRWLGPDVALADGQYEIRSTRDGRTRQLRTHFVLQRVGGEWRIAAIRNMEPALGAAPAAQPAPAQPQ